VDFLHDEDTIVMQFDLASSAPILEEYALKLWLARQEQEPIGR